MKKIIFLTLFVLILSGCSLSSNKTPNKLTEEDGEKVIFHFSNVITNPFNNDHYFIIKDTSDEKGFFCLTKFGDSETIFLDECKKTGSYCGNTTNEDSELCLLARQEKDKKWEPIANLFFPDSNKFCDEGIECSRFDGKNGMPGAELLKFSAINILDIFYGKNTNNINHQEIRKYDTENDKLSEQIVFYNFADNQSYFAVGNKKGFLLFINDIKNSPILWGSKIQNTGIYFVEDNFSNTAKVTKMVLPNKYNSSEKLLVEFDIKNSYEDNNLIEFVVRNYGTKYSFNFSTKKIETLN